METEDDEVLPDNPNITSAEEIAALQSDVVHKICADRVIGSLAVAVKELVENSIDAGASRITVRVKGHGIDSVEVTDNGRGVRESDFEALTKSYHTSKLSDFSDLENVGTFGFRGEALSSLCRLCSGISVVTRHASASCASRLHYDAAGKLVSNTPCSGEVGTVIKLEQLFSPLPVRRKVFVSRCQQEFNKTLQLLHAYCIIAEGIRIQVHHQKDTSKDWCLLVNSPGTCMLDNLACVAGHKSLDDLMPFPTKEQSGFTLKGYISSCAHGAGRRTPDKQFYYINGRPCDLPKANRLVNQLYKQLNKHQAPLVIMNVITKSSGSVDVNIAPDKRSVALKGEPALLQLIKDTLMDLYNDIPSTLPVNSQPALCFNGQVAKSSPQSTVLKSNSPKLDKFMFGKNSPKSTTTSSALQTPARVKGLQQFACSPNTSLSAHSAQTSSDFSDQAVLPSITSINRPQISSLLARKESTKQPTPSSSTCPHASTPNNSRNLDRFRCLYGTNKLSSNGPTKRPAEDKDKKMKMMRMDSYVVKTTRTSPPDESIVEIATSEPDTLAMNDVNTNSGEHEVASGFQIEIVEETETPRELSEPKIFLDNQTSHQDTKAPADNHHSPIEDPVTLPRQEVTLQLGLKHILERMKLQTSEKKNETSITPARFHASFTDGVKAEQELRREISKDMFLNMLIIGQFNKAFILAELQGDIFIIDQHAADEKFNFERLSKGVAKTSQRLVMPQPVNLNPVQESIFIENKTIFQENGFEFIISDTAQPANKIRLTAVPSMFHLNLGVDDVLELLHQIEESPLERPQAKRIRAVLASKACRQSVMVGDALPISSMLRHVQNLSTLDHPWNCPHGRPTMRHLVNIVTARQAKQTF